MMQSFRQHHSHHKLRCFHLAQLLIKYALLLFPYHEVEKGHVNFLNLALKIAQFQLLHEFLFDKARDLSIHLIYVFSLSLENLRKWLYQPLSNHILLLSF